MAKGSKRDRAAKTAKKRNEKAKVRKIRELKLTELEVANIKLVNEKIARWNAEKQAAVARIGECDRNGIEAQGEMNSLLIRINKRLGVDIRAYNIDDSGLLRPKTAPPAMAPEPSEEEAAGTEEASAKEE